jgi:hypothetical protein
MAFDRAAAKAEGYTDDEINAFLQAQSAENKTTPVNSIEDLPAPTTVIQEPESGFASTATTVGLAAAPYVLPAAAAGAAALGGSKLYSSWKSGTQAAEQIAAAKLASEAGIADREFVRQGVMTPQEALQRQAEREAALKAGKPIPAMSGPVAPTGPTATGPVAPSQQANMMRRVQAAAANRIQNLPGANVMGQAGKFAGKLLPGVGTALNAADAYNRAQEGDYLGAGIAGVGAAASPFPVVGTAVGVGTASINAYRDYLKRQEEEKKRMMK